MASFIQDIFEHIENENKKKTWWQKNSWLIATLFLILFAILIVGISGYFIGKLILG